MILSPCRRPPPAPRPRPSLFTQRHVWISVTPAGAWESNPSPSPTSAHRSQSRNKGSFTWIELTPALIESQDKAVFSAGPTTPFVLSHKRRYTASVCRRFVTSVTAVQSFLSVFYLNHLDSSTSLETLQPFSPRFIYPEPFDSDAIAADSLVLAYVGEP